MTQATPRPLRSAIAAHPVTAAAIALLVAADIAVVLYVPLYARVTPRWGDFPFFYWYLLIIMPVTSLALWLAATVQRWRVASGPGGPGAGPADGGTEVHQ